VDDDWSRAEITVPQDRGCLIKDGNAVCGKTTVSTIGVNLHGHTVAIPVCADHAWLGMTGLHTS
jgi:hypothetical protein